MFKNLFEDSLNKKIIKTMSDLYWSLCKEQDDLDFSFDDFQKNDLLKTCIKNISDKLTDDKVCFDFVRNFSFLNEHKTRFSLIIDNEKKGLRIEINLFEKEGIVYFTDTKSGKLRVSQNPVLKQKMDIILEELTKTLEKQKEIVSKIEREFAEKTRI